MVARTVKLPFTPIEVAVGPAGSLYLTRAPLRTDPPVAPLCLPPMRLARLSASGKALWTSRLGTGIGNVNLRTGPDGTLYWVNLGRDQCSLGPGWMPAATPAGRPLSRAAQARRRLSAQPLPGGQQLVMDSAGWKQLPGWGLVPYEARLALVNRAENVVRAWRVKSRTIIWWEWVHTPPGLVDGDPVIVLAANRPPIGLSGTYEYLVLRLGPRGGVRTRFALTYNDPPRTPFNKSAIKEIQVQPDGKLYQLGSSPDFGAAIYRYSLGHSR